MIERIESIHCDSVVEGGKEEIRNFHCGMERSESIDCDGVVTGEELSIVMVG